MGHASVRSQQSYGRKSKKAKVDLMTSQMSKPMLNPVAVIDYWDLRSQIKTKQRQKLPILPPPAVLHRLPFVASKCEPWAVQEVPSWTVKGWPVRQDGFIATSSIAKQKPGTGNLEGFPPWGIDLLLENQWS